MNLSDQDHYYIDLYLMGLLKSPDLEQFQDRLKKDEAFAESVAKQVLMIQALKEQERRQTKQELQKIYNQFKSRPPSNSNRFKLSIYFGTAAVILLLLTLLWVSNKQESKQAELFTQYYSPFPTRPLTRDGNNYQNQDERKEKIWQAVKFYNAKNYQNALTIFLSITKHQGTSKRYHLMIGSCYLSLNEYSKAEIWFESVLNSSDPLIKNHGEWYLALTYLAQSKQKEATYFLQSLSQKESAYQNEAKALLKKMH